MDFRTILQAIFLVGTQLSVTGQQVIYSSKSGSIHFRSDAQLELINARSQELSGAINPETHGMAFSVQIKSFEGFNSAVQQVHFMENYMEATKYPVATFTGKIIERIKFHEPGIHDVRVKGILNIHGINTERIIPGKLTIQGDTVHVEASFTVPLEDHDIGIPRLLSQKIAEMINVQVDIDLQKN
jgi:polyisoprenoid-binding protein YceI